MIELKFGIGRIGNLAGAAADDGIGLSVRSLSLLSGVLTDGLLTLIGVAIGTALSTMVEHCLKSLLFDVSSSDAVTLLDTIAVVVSAGTAATLLPAGWASLVQIASMV